MIHWCCVFKAIKMSLFIMAVTVYKKKKDKQTFDKLWKMKSCNEATLDGVVLVSGMQDVF